MKPLLPALAILALAVSTSFSQSVVNSSVIPCDALGGVIVCPDMPNPIPATKVTVVVRDAGNNPMPNVPVNLGFGSGAINVCPGAILSGVTNANGEATGGGRMRPESECGQDRRKRNPTSHLRRQESGLRRRWRRQERQLGGSRVVQFWRAVP